MRSYSISWYKMGWFTNSLDSLPGPPPTQPALTDSTVDGLVSTTYPRFFKPSYMPQKWLKMPFVYVCISPCAFILYVRTCMSVCTCEGLCACLHLYVCIVLSKSGRQLGLVRRECAGKGAIRGWGITKGGENGEYSCVPLWPKHKLKGWWWKKEWKLIGLFYYSSSREAWLIIISFHEEWKRR